MEGSSPLYKVHAHHTGDLHTTGEAVNTLSPLPLILLLSLSLTHTLSLSGNHMLLQLYTDDISEVKGTLHACLVLSTVAHGRILSIDASEAESAKGVVAFFGAEDVPINVGEMFGDGELFVSKEVVYYGQPLGAVVADTKKRAERAAKLVKARKRG